MKMRRPRRRVAHVPEPPFITKTASCMLRFGAPKEQQDLVAGFLVINQHLIGPAFALPVHVQIVSVQPVVVLRHIASFLLRDEQPDGLMVLRTKDTRINGGVVNLEFLAEVLARVKSAILQLFGASHVQRLLRLAFR